jgi:enolase-phosphatase E1
MSPKFSAIVTDIEGTACPIRFVTETLFPYARKRLRNFIEQHAGRPDVAEQLAAARALGGLEDRSDAAVTALLLGWMDEDRKATPLKALQGFVWAEGYREGSLTSEIYPEVPDRLRAWHAGGLRLFVYSSGSVEAQRLLFGHTPAGDLTPIFEGFFDTKIGGKLAVASYQALVAAIGLPAGQVLFLSDHEGELDAAASAGIVTACLDREGDGRSDRHPVHRDFSTIEPAPL